jgi:hypothetical protein
MPLRARRSGRARGRGGSRRRARRSSRCWRAATPLPPSRPTPARPARQVLRRLEPFLRPARPASHTRVRSLPRRGGRAPTGGRWGERRRRARCGRCASRRRTRCAQRSRAPRQCVRSSPHSTAPPRRCRRARPAASARCVRAPPARPLRLLPLPSRRRRGPSLPLAARGESLGVQDPSSSGRVGGGVGLRAAARVCSCACGTRR